MENNSYSFINYTDPTKPLDFDYADGIIHEVSLKDSYDNLSDYEKLMVAARILGMNHLPVDMHTFLFDDYFLGADTITNHGSAIFKFWQDKFDQIFPTPVSTRTPYISFGGAIGTGKSTISKYIGLYYYHRLDCCENVYASLGMAGGVKLAIAAFHSSAETADRDFVRYFKFVMETSPYFRTLYNNPPIRFISSGPQSTGAVLGSQLVFSILSELGFWRPQDAKAKMDEVIGRYESRFKNKRFVFGGVIADSSAKDSDNSASKRFEERTPARELFKISPAQWEVRPELYAESNGQTFKFYRGDTVQEPRIVDDSEDIIKSGLDPDRIINVPISAKYHFMSDPVRSLRDLAGIPYSGNELFFNNNLSHLLACSKLKNLVPEIITVDFYDKSDSIFQKVAPMIYRIPRRTHIFVHYDIGLQKDITGVSLCYFNGETTMGDVVLPTFKFPLIFGVSRKKGQSTSLDHLYQFLKDLINEGYTVTFSADSFASAGLFQSCQRDGIDYKALSVDRTMDAANMFKNVINTERAELPYHNVLLRECSELRVVMNGKNGEHMKVDHPLISSCTEFDYADLPPGTERVGSKDISDSCFGSLYSCYQKYAEYLETGMAGGVNMAMKSLNNLTKDAREESQKQFQSMLEGIF